MARINVSGTDDNNIKMREGNAAFAKKASDEYDHISDVRVLKSNGDSINTAGNSFIVTRNTIAPPITIPGFNSGKVTEIDVLNAPLPSVREASSILGLICNIVLLTAPSPVGR